MNWDKVEDKNCRLGPMGGEGEAFIERPNRYKKNSAGHLERQRVEVGHALRSD